MVVYIIQNVFHFLWLKLVHVAELDVLISLAIASEYYEGPTRRPIILDSSSLDEVPCYSAKSLGHPVLRSDSLGKGTFVPNEIIIGGSGHANFILLTGPNMGVGGEINSSLPSLLGFDFGPGNVFVVFVVQL